MPVHEARESSNFCPVSSPEELTARVRSLVPLFATMELQVVSADVGTATVEIPEEPNLNHAGIVYAGSLFSVAEVLGGLIPLTTWDAPGFVPLVKDVRIEFLRPARGRVRATATLDPAEIARVREALSGTDKVDFELAASLTGENGREVARTLSSYQLRRIEPT